MVGLGEGWLGHLAERGNGSGGLAYTSYRWCRHDHEEQVEGHRLGMFRQPDRTPKPPPTDEF